MSPTLSNTYFTIWIAFTTGMQMLLLFTKWQNFRLVQIESIVLGRVENIMGKEENVVYQHFLLFPQYFQKASKTRLFR